MLHLLDETLEAFLRATVPLSARQVDVSFEAPDSEWGAGVTKPTINLFLWNLRQNLDERESGMQLVEDEDGNRIRRPRDPRVDCRYLVTAWTTEVQDEHRLLGSVLSTLLTHDEIDAEYLQGEYASVRPVPTLVVARPDGEQDPDLWSALGGQLKPALNLVVTATVDLRIKWEIGPPVERFDLDLLDRTASERASAVRTVGGRVEDGPGVVVRSARGSTVTDAEGRFLIRGEEGDEVVTEGEEPLAGEVPASGAVPLRGRSSRGKR
jgi:Pvc16 N-terminal domain